MTSVAGYPRIIAHRCGGALAPENTLEGLRIAARLGVRGVEFDVMLTADGVPVLMHDETLERTTTGSGKLADTTAASLARLDAGSRHHHAFAVSPAPTFAEALELCAELGLWANVEIKPSSGADISTGQAVAQMAAGARCALVLSSFSFQALSAAAMCAPELKRALLVESVPDDWREQMTSIGATALHLASDALTLTPVELAAACTAAIPVAAYTVNNRAQADRLFAAGVRSIFTDRPDVWRPDEM